MKKVTPYLLLAILFAALLLLTSCGEGEGYPFAAAVCISELQEFWFEGRAYGVDTVGHNPNQWIYVREGDSNEKKPVCRDPLCDHRGGCPALVSLYGNYLAVVRNGRGEICLFFTDARDLYRDEFKDSHKKYDMYCLNLDTMEKTAIFKGMTDQVYGFCLYKDDIYLTIDSYKKDEEKQKMVLTGAGIWKVPVTGGEPKQLTMGDGKFSGEIYAIAQAKGKTYIYWRDHYDNRTLYVSPIDLSEKTKLAENVAIGSFVVGDALYYAVDHAEAEPPFRVPAVPGDSEADEDGMRTFFAPGIDSEIRLAAYYKRDLTDPNAKPELVYDGVRTPGFLETPLLADGNVIYVIPYAPALAATITASDIDPEEGVNPVGYIIDRSSRGIVAIDLTTGEEREIRTPGLEVRGLCGSADGKLNVFGYTADKEGLVENMKARSKKSWTETLKEGALLGVGEWRLVDTQG